MPNSAAARHRQVSNTDILGHIHNMLPTLSKTQSKIALAILSYPRQFVGKPIEELVSWIGVSAPTITRFCRSVGCDGLRDLKLMVMETMSIGARYLEGSTPPTTFEDMREYTVTRARHGLAIALRIPGNVIEQTIDRLLAARAIYAFGSGGVSSWLCEEVQNRLFRIGLTVIPCRDGIMQSMFAATTRREDVILCCSLGGNNHATLEAMRIAHEYGAYCIAICPPESRIEEAADLAIPVDTHDEGDVLCPTSARYSMLLAIDMIAFGAAMRSRKNSTESLRRIKRQFVAHIDPDQWRPLSD